MTNEERQIEIQKLLKDAKTYPTKGRYYVYERFKNRLINLNPTPEEYEQTCRELSNCLRI